MRRGFLPNSTTHSPDELLAFDHVGRSRLLDSWAISDLHLGHERLEIGGPLGALRPRGFTATLVATIRREIRPNDDLLTLGDSLVGWPHGQPMPWLPGTLWTVQGNHDRGKVDKLLARGWRILDPFSTVYRDWVITFTHEPIPPD